MDDLEIEVSEDQLFALKVFVSRFYLYFRIYFYLEIGGVFLVIR